MLHLSQRPTAEVSSYCTMYIVICIHSVTLCVDLPDAYSITQALLAGRKPLGCFVDSFVAFVGRVFIVYTSLLKLHV